MKNESVKTSCLGKSSSRLKCKNAFGQSDCRVFKLYLKNYWSYKVDFVHAASYLDHVSLGGCGPGMPKEAFETYISQKQYNDKNLFIYFNSRGKSCYAYIAGVNSVATLLLLILILFATT